MILKKPTPTQASALRDNPRLGMLQLSDNRLVQAFFDWLTGLLPCSPSLEKHPLLRANLWHTPVYSRRISDRP